VVAAVAVGINQPKLLPTYGTKERACMTNSFDKNKYIDKLHKDIAKHLKEGGEIKKLPMSPDVAKLRHDIVKDIFTKRF